MRKKVLGAAGFLLGSLLAMSTLMPTHYAKASVEQETTETNKVAVDDTVAIAAPGKYKNMDDSFLATFDFGATREEKTVLTFDTVEQMENSEDTKLKEGRVFQTKGYYSVGDGGGASYILSSKKRTGAVRLKNELYANILPDSYTDEQGTKWLVCNVRQFGAKGDGVHVDHPAINAAVSFAGDLVNTEDSYSRALVYIPKGEFKCTDQLFANTKNINLVGAGKDTVLFTDNDYRKDNGYSEHFFQISDAENLFIGKFVIEAREVDLYHYMRQFTMISCTDMYIYQVDLIVPQGAYSSYYFEDKQYSNMCVYSGNRKITVDGCKMVQLSGTYRGANFGILDIWAKGEEDITVMNCDMYGNARDEQIGFFSKDDPNASVKHVDFINNTVHSVQLKYTNIIGTRTMCFTVAYQNSKNVDDIRIAGNHFICETDSKFMTFGAVTNCVLENNIIEVIGTNGQMGYVFDSGNTDPKNILVRNNEFFVSKKKEGQGKQSVCYGCLTFTGNKVVADAPLAFNLAEGNCIVNENQVEFLESVSSLSANCYEFNRNTVNCYDDVQNLISVNLTDDSKPVNFTGNAITNYHRYIGTREKRGKGVWCALMNISGSNVCAYNVLNNTYMCPNMHYKRQDYITKEYIDEEERVAYVRENEKSAVSVLNVVGNTFQGAYGFVSYGDISNFIYNEQNHTVLPFSADENETPCSSSDITYNGNMVAEMTVTEDTVQLGNIMRVADATDEEGKVLTEEVASDKKVRWLTSVNSIATVSDTGIVTRKLYGDVKVFAVSLDGSGVYATCILHFEKKKAENITLAQDTVELQPKLRYYMEYEIIPQEANQGLQWTSSDESVATVDKNGMITAVAEGQAVVTGTTTDGSQLSKSITVKVESVTVKKIELDKSCEIFEYTDIGKTDQLSVKQYIPTDAINCSIGKWVSSDEEVIKVDQNGLVTLVGPGKASVRAYSTDDYCSGYCAFIIRMPKVENLTVSEVKNNSLKLTWKKAAKAEGYFVYQWDDAKSEWTKLKDIPKDANKDTEEETIAFDINNLSSNKKYKFCVRAYLYHWITTGKDYTEGYDTTIEATTLAYAPVTKINSAYKNITLHMAEKGEVKTFDVTYTPSTGTDSNLDFTIKIADESIAKITKIEKENGKRNITLEALKYGITSITITSNDAWGASLTIPVGVVTSKMLSMKPENIRLSEEGGKVTIAFDAIANEAELLQTGAMTGYQICRTQGANYTPVAYIPADASLQYSFVDDTVLRAQGYNYMVQACLTDGENYFGGYGNGGFYIFVSAAVETESVTTSQDTYMVAVGDTVEIDALIGPEDVDTTVLSWKSADEGIATVKRTEKEQYIANHEYALVTGVQVGTTTVTMKTKDNTNIEKTVTIIVSKEVPKLTVPPTIKPSDTPGTTAQQQTQETPAAHVTESLETEHPATGSPVLDQKEPIVTQTQSALNQSVTIANPITGSGIENKVEQPTSLSVMDKQVADEGLVVGQKYTIGGKIYQYLGNGNMSIVGMVNKKKNSLKIGKTVLCQGGSYKITRIGKKAFKNSILLKKVTIGKQVKVIENSAFENCKKLKNVQIRGKKISKIGKNAWKNTNQNLVFKVPKKEKKTIKNLLKSKTGYRKTMQLKYR